LQNKGERIFFAQVFAGVVGTEIIGNGFGVFGLVVFGTVKANREGLDFLLLDVN
jgi:hypothetical protein